MILRRLTANFLLLPALRLLDLVVPKKKNYWGFSPHHIKSGQFIENSRAVYEHVKKDPEICKIVFAREHESDFKICEGCNTIVVPLKSLRGIRLILQCRVLFVTHSVAMDYSLRWQEGGFSVFKLSMRRRVVVNLWHGIPVKKLYALWNPKVRGRLDRVKFRRTERRYYAGLVTSSEVDSYAMTTMFHPIKYDQIFLTGLPRNDFLLQDEKQQRKSFGSKNC